MKNLYRKTRGGGRHRLITLAILVALLASTVFSFAASSDIVAVQYNHGASNKWSWTEGHEGDVTSNNTWNTRERYITKIKMADGTVYDTRNDEEADQSLLYCMEPGTEPPLENQWTTIEGLDDEDMGKKAKLRKAVYYMKGSPGYKKVTKARWFDQYDGNSGVFALGHILISYLYNSSNSAVDKLDTTNMVSDRDKTWIRQWAADLDNLDDPPEGFDVVIVKTANRYQTLIGPVFLKTEKLKLKKSSANTSITG